MGMKEALQERSMELTGLLSFLVITGINIVSKTPLIYVLTLAGLVALVYSAKKFRNQFDVKLFFRTRSEGRNYWGAALAGVSAFLMTLIVQATDSTFSEEVAIIAAIVTLALLLSTLFYASILQDIKDGELDLEKIE